MNVQEEVRSKPQRANAVYGAINRPRTIMGMDYHVFLLLIVGTYVVFLYGTSTAALATAVIGRWLGRWLYRHDPRILGVLRKTASFKASRFDPLKRRVLPVRWC